MNKTTMKELSVRLRRQMIQRFFLSYLLYLAVGAVLFFLIYLYYHGQIWYGYESFYLLIQLLERFWLFLLLGYTAGGALVVGCRQLSRAEGYLEEMLLASEQLFQGKEQDRKLSSELQPVQVYLDSIRLQIENSRRAAQDAEQRKNDLVVYLAHDLKTPLTSVIGYLTLLSEEEELSPELRKKYLGVSLEKAERLEDLINEFFEITRFSLTHLSLELTRISLTRMLEQTVFEFQPMLEEKGLTCRLDAPQDITYLCDPDKLQRVLDNLLRNAVSYSYPGREIRIRLSARETELCLQVKNEGRTIPPDKLERIFDQFFRLDSARTSRSGGAGLGLAIAKEIVELHGGRILAQSAEEQVTFTVLLPVNDGKTGREEESGSTVKENLRKP